jgi:transcriptional regulator with XRE-family HTH domain
MDERSVYPDGRKVRQLRLQAGWSQLDLAQKAGVSKRTVENIEAIKAVLPRKLSAVARALGINMTALLMTQASLQAAETDWEQELSPFIAGPAITHPRYFFGRKHALKGLFSLWQRRPLQHATILGPQHSGKTSLLLYLKHITTIPPAQLRPSQRSDWLPEPKRYRWIFVDFQDPRVGTREGLLHYLLAQLELPVPTPCGLDEFLTVVSDGLRNPTVILLDEVGVALHRYPELDSAFWESWRALATTQVGGNLAFVLTAEESPTQLAAHSGHSSPFFSMFAYVAELGPMMPEEARELITSSPIPFPAADVDWILTQSQCWPLLVQILCRERLAALEDGEADDTWQERGRRHMEPFRYLLENP